MMCTRRLHPVIASLLAVAIRQAAFGQVTYPDNVVKDVTWLNGSHPVGVTPGILSPGTLGHPVVIMSTAQAEFVSGTRIHLTDGFHAGWFTDTGSFRARIEQTLGPPADLVVISPDPTTHLVDNVLHVEEHEKLEIGLQLPLEYRQAIDRFFAHYYSSSISPNISTPDSVDATHDLNPYADDSLQVVMTLTGPSGQQRTKWGFFMREAKWASANDDAKLTDDTTDLLDPYRIRFRFAPDEAGAWQFSLSVKAPYTTTLAGSLLGPLHCTGYTFVCDPPLPTNHGPLHVNTANRRTLQFEDGTSFFGLGVNMADWRRSTPGYGDVYRQRDHTTMLQTMEQLHGVGGNFMRMFLMEKIFAPEYVNLGVYDRYKSVPCCANGTGTNFEGNCQYQCWAFDRMLEQAHDQEIYIQLCIDPYPPIIDYQPLGWGANAYWLQFVKPHPQSAPLNPYDLKRFFYTDGDTTDTADGAFYYWKRKYKYIMSRWGYSVNVPIVEPFNEVNQMLSYGDFNVTGNCAEMNVPYAQDSVLPVVLDQWLTDIITHVKGAVDSSDLVTSPLGESDKLFLMSYTDGTPADTPNENYYRPFKNPNVSLIDVHRGLGAGGQDVKYTFDMSKSFRDTYLSAGHKKPFHNGEYSTYAQVDADGFSFNGNEYDSGRAIDNYDVSFHNELWASTFFGNFASGTTWQWDRVFWWPDAMLRLPPQTSVQNPFQQSFSNALGATSLLNVGGVSITAYNRTIHHNFKPLSDMLADPDWQAYAFFDGDYDTYRVYDEENDIECYYLINTDGTIGIGWVHNLNAYWQGHFYVKHNLQNYLGCTAPGMQTVELPGFASGMNYNIRWFSTRMNSTIRPDDAEDEAGTGTVTLDMSTAPLGGIANNYLDTLHADYAFIITPSPEHRSMIVSASADATNRNLDFAIYPNPAWDMLTVSLPDDAPRNIAIRDLSGRLILDWGSVRGPLLHLPVKQLARGAYYVRVSDETNSQVKQLIIR